MIGFDLPKFSSIEVTGADVDISGIVADSFIWTRATSQSKCSDCGSIRLNPTGRFFRCTDTPQFSSVSATVVAPSCRLSFVDSDVTILRDKSSPTPVYVNTSVTDFSDLIEIFGPKYEATYFTGFKNYYDSEWQRAASTLGIVTVISIVSLFIVHPDMFSFF